MFDSNYFEFIPIELSGKGKRIGEANYRSFQELVSDVYTIISRHIQSNECGAALWGHSMGGIVAFEIIKLLEHNYTDRSKLLFVSGCETPEDISKDLFSKIEDVEKIRTDIIQGEWMPESIINNKKNFDYFVQILLKDFSLLAEYKYDKELLNVPIVIMNGNDDTIVEHKERGWDKYTRGNVYYRIFEGGHFFIDSNLYKIVKCITEHCKELV